MAGMADPIMGFDHTQEILDAVKSGSPVYIKDECTDLVYGFNNDEYFNLETFRRFWSDGTRTVLVDLVVRDGHAPDGPLCRTNAWVSVAIAIAEKPTGTVAAALRNIRKHKLEEGFPLENLRVKYATYDNFRMTYREAEKFLDGIKYETVTKYELFGRLKEKQDAYQEKFVYYATSGLPKAPEWDSFPTDEEIAQKKKERPSRPLDIDPEKCNIYLGTDDEIVKIQSGSVGDTYNWNFLDGD